MFTVDVRGRIASRLGCLPCLRDRKRSREKRWGEKQTGRCQGYGNREDSKNGWRVLPDIGVMLQGEEGKLSPGVQFGDLLELIENEMLFSGDWVRRRGCRSG